MRGIGCCAMQARSILQRGSTGRARQLSWLDPHKTFSSQYLDWCYLALTVHILRGEGGENDKRTYHAALACFESLLCSFHAFGSRPQGILVDVHISNRRKVSAVKG